MEFINKLFREEKKEIPTPPPFPEKIFPKENVDTESDDAPSSEDGDTLRATLRKLSFQNSPAQQAAQAAARDAYTLIKNSMLNAAYAGETSYETTPALRTKIYTQQDLTKQVGELARQDDLDVSYTSDWGIILQWN